MTVKTLPAILSVLAVIAGGLIASAFADFGPLSFHMATHIAAMNVVAPLLAVLVMGLGAPHSFSSRYWLWIGAGAQLLLLVAWHMPPLHHLLASSTVTSAIVGSVMMLAALSFWLALLAQAEAAPWQAMLALMLNAKVACLLGGILVFAPHYVYAMVSHHAAMAPLDDQQLAGLLMLAVCPLSYVVAGIAVAAQMMARLEREAATPATMPQAGTVAR